MLNVIILSVTFRPFMLIVIMLSVTYKPFMLNVIMLNVVVPLTLYWTSSKLLLS